MNDAEHDHDGRTIAQWRESLTDDDAEVRLRAVRAITHLGSAGRAPACDAALAALKSRPTFGKGRETDGEVRTALFDGVKRVAAARARRHGMRVARPTDLATLDPRAVVRCVLEHIWDAATIYEGRTRLLSILEIATPGQRAVYTCHWTDSEVSNGGFHQYLWNSTGVVAPDAIEGFRRLGKPELAEIVEQALAVLPSDVRTDDQGARQDALEQIAPESFDALNERYYERHVDLYEAMADYVRDHPAELFEPEDGESAP